MSFRRLRGIFIRMEHLASHLHISHGKTLESKSNSQKTPVEARKRLEINSCKKWIDPKERIIEISVNENEQSTIHCNFDFDFLDEYLHNLEEGFHEQKVDESQLSHIPMAVEEDGH